MLAGGWESYLREPGEELDAVIQVVFPSNYRGRLAHLLGWGVTQFHRDEEHETTWGVYEQLRNGTQVEGGELVTASRRTFVRASYLYLEALRASSDPSDDWWEIHEFLVKEIQEREPIEEAGFGEQL